MFLNATDFSDFTYICIGIINLIASDTSVLKWTSIKDRQKQNQNMNNVDEIRIIKVERNCHIIMTIKSPKTLNFAFLLGIKIN